MPSSSSHGSCETHSHSGLRSRFGKKLSDCGSVSDFGDVYALKIVEKLHVNARAAYDEALFKVFRRVQRFAGAVHDQRAVHVDALAGDDDVEAVCQGLAARKIGKRFAADYDGGAVGKAAEMTPVGLERRRAGVPPSPMPQSEYTATIASIILPLVLTVLRVFFRQKA